MFTRTPYPVRISRFIIRILRAMSKRLHQWLSWYTNIYLRPQQLVRKSLYELRWSKVFYLITDLFIWISHLRSENVLGWSGGAMVLGKLSVPGRPTIWIIVGQGPTALTVGAGAVVWTFLLSFILSLLFLPLFGRRPDIDWNTVSKGR